MHEADAGAVLLTLRKHQSALNEEVVELFSSALRDAVEREQIQHRVERERTRDSVRREAGEWLNQAVRAIRQADSESAVLDSLRQAAAANDVDVVVAVVRSAANTWDVRVAPAGGNDAADSQDRIDVQSAPAVRSAIETRDPVVTLPTSGEIGTLLACRMEKAAGEQPGNNGKAYLFPVHARQISVAVLVACGAVQPAALELLCEAAGMRMENLTAPPIRKSEPAFVQIAAPVASEDNAPAPRKWEELSANEQKLHLQAQRVARVKVAEMRLYNAGELRRGTSQSNIYESLRAQIDAARAEFLQTFLAKSATMVDYLHLEILRSLAHDDDRLLGKTYPGPMV